MPIIRLYRPIEEDLQAIKFEQGEKKSIILPHDLEENIQRFYTKYLAILRDENHAVIELGMGNIGKATLFLSEQTKPFVRKTFHDTNCYSFKHENIIVGKTFDGTNYYIHQHQNLSVASMNFMIDLRIMRAVQG